MNLKEIERAHNYDVEIDIDTFLTPEKIDLIATTMMGKDSQIKRDYIENIMLAKLCTDIGEDYDYVDNYNTLQYNGVFDVIKQTIKNVEDIDRYIAREESLNMEVGKFLKELMKYLNKSEKDLKKLDLDKAGELLEKYGKR